MSHRSTRSAAVALAALTVFAAACGRSRSTVTDDLQRDLDLASTPGVELAPTAGRVDVVSSIEQGRAGEAAKSAAPTAAAPKAAPRATPKRVASAPRVAIRTPAPAPVREPVVETPTVVAESPAPAPPPADEPAPTVSRAPVPAPMPVPAPRGRQRGGTWTMGDVIRNAPFPINP